MSEHQWDIIMWFLGIFGTIAVAGIIGLCTWLFNYFKARVENVQYQDKFLSKMDIMGSKLEGIEKSNTLLVQIQTQQAEKINIIQEEMEYTADFYFNAASHFDKVIGVSNEVAKAVVEMQGEMIDSGIELKERLDYNPIPKFKDIFIGFDKRDPHTNSQVA